MLLQLPSLSCAGHCFNFFKNLGVQEYKWLWLFLFTLEDPSKKTSIFEPQGPLRETSHRALDCKVNLGPIEEAAVLNLWSSVPVFYFYCPTSLMLLVLTLLTLVPCLVLLTWYFFSTGGKSGGNKKNDGVKVSPLHSWLIQPRECLPSRWEGPSVAQSLCTKPILLILSWWISCIILFLSWVIFPYLSVFPTRQQKRKYNYCFYLGKNYTAERK